MTSGPPNSSIWIARMRGPAYSSVAALAKEAVEHLHELRAVRAGALQPARPRLAAEVAERRGALAQVVLVGGPRGRGAELGAVGASAGALVRAQPALGVRLDLLEEALRDVRERARRPAEDLHRQAGEGVRREAIGERVVACQPLGEAVAVQVLQPEPGVPEVLLVRGVSRAVEAVD